MSRLTELRDKLAENHGFDLDKHMTPTQMSNMPYTIATEAYKSGFDAASAEYEKILMKLERSIITAVSYLKVYHGEDDLEGEPENAMLKDLRQVLSKLKEFRGEK